MRRFHQKISFWLYLPMLAASLLTSISVHAQWWGNLYLEQQNIYNNPGYAASRGSQFSGCYSGPCVLAGYASGAHQQMAYQYGQRLNPAIVRGAFVDAAITVGGEFGAAGVGAAWRAYKGFAQSVRLTGKVLGEGSHATVYEGRMGLFRNVAAKVDTHSEGFLGAPLPEAEILAGVTREAANVELLANLGLGSVKYLGRTTVAGRPAIVTNIARGTEESFELLNSLPVRDLSNVRLQLTDMGLNLSNKYERAFGEIQYTVGRRGKIELFDVESIGPKDQFFLPGEATPENVVYWTLRRAGFTDELILKSGGSIPGKRAAAIIGAGSTCVGLVCKPAQ